MSEQQEIKSSDVTLKRLLTELNYLFRVPNYQRHYVWTEKEVQLFLRDGEFCWRKYAEDGQIFIHFAGQLILRRMDSDRENRTRVEIIDGQQRLTTFTLLVSAAIRMMQQQGGCDKQIEALEKTYLTAKSEFGDSQQILELSTADQAFWKLLTNTKRELPQEVSSVESHKLLQKAEKVIYSQLEKLTAGKTSDEICDILSAYIDATAQSFRFVLLQTTQPGYMYALFQIVNDRGLPLTSGELLKARIMEFFSAQPELADEAEQIWDDILKDAGTVTNRYLGWNYMAVTDRRAETRKGVMLHELYEQDIFCCYNKRALSEEEKRVVKEQMEHLSANVARARVLERGVIPADGVSEYTKIMYEALILLLKNTLSIPLYLKILEMNEKQIGKTINNITPMLAKSFFIAKTMGGLHDESIARCYLEIWKYIDRNSADIDAIRGCLERLITKEGCKKEFVGKIKQDVYVHGASGNAKAKFLLLMLELDHARKVETGQKECGDDSFKIHIQELSVEHILKDSVDARDVSKHFYEGREKIGNLTLIGKKLNSRLKNKDFENKREIYLASPYWITREVGTLEHWIGKDFDARQKELVEALKNMFEFLQ